MKIGFVQRLAIVKHLFKRDLIELRKEILPLLLDSIIWPTRMLIVYGFILTGAGLEKKFGEFLFVGLIPSISFLRINNNLSKIMSDLENNQYIYYELLLPLTANMVFFRRALILSLKSFILAIPIIFAGIGILLSGSIYFSVNYIHFFLILIVSNLMFGFGTIWISSWLKTSLYITSVWNRYLHTIWIFGCLFYPWKIFYTLFPFAAILSLANPFVYVMEGARSTVFNTADYLNFWICLAMIILFTIYFAYKGIYLLKRRLDLVI